MGIRVRTPRRGSTGMRFFRDTSGKSCRTPFSITSILSSGRWSRHSGTAPAWNCNSPNRTPPAGRSAPAFRARSNVPHVGCILQLREVSADLPGQVPSARARSTVAVESPEREGVGVSGPQPHRGFALP